MGTVRRPDRLAGALAAAAAAGVLVTLLAGGGCELVVSDAVPSFSCLLDASNTCPSGSVCSVNHQCVAQGFAPGSPCTPGESYSCAGNLVCDPELRRCEPSTAMTPDAADDGSTADATSAISSDTGTDAPSAFVDTGSPMDASGVDGPTGIADASPDVQVACRGLGCRCSGPSDCDSGICADALTATSALYSAASDSNFCTQSCCTSADCPGANVCFATGGGGNYCVSPRWIMRSATPGAAGGGASCSGASDCRSALCVSGACADTCCSTAQEGSECAAGTVCRFSAFPGNGFDAHETAWCGAAIGKTAAGAPCAVDGTCESGKCGFTRCEAACRTSTDCSGAGQACSYGPGPTTLPTNNDIVAGCMNVTGPTANGSSCTMNADCLSGFCDGSQCTDICVSDSDCMAGYHCRPKVVQVQGSYSVLCCQKLT